MKALKELKKEDLVTFFNQKIRYNGFERRKLSVAVFGNQHHRQLAIAKGELPSPSTYSNCHNICHANGACNSQMSNDANATLKQNEIPSHPNGNVIINDHHRTSDASGKAPSLPADIHSRQIPRRIDNVQVFKRSQSFYCSPKVAL